MTIVKHSPINGNDNGTPEADIDQNGGHTITNEETESTVLNETNQQQKDEAVMMALINIYNCIPQPAQSDDRGSPNSRV
jgi:hypothetical protein